MQIAEIYISHIIDTGSGFAARTDDGEQVFIPASVTKASGAKEGEIGTAKLIPNTHQNNAATPWVAVHIAKQDGTVLAPAVQEKTLDDRVHEAVCDLGYATTSEIVKEVNADVALAHNALLRLFNKGRLAKADIYARADQDRASFCMWAKDVKHFLGEAGE
jgi:ribosomal protein S25